MIPTELLVNAFAPHRAHLLAKRFIIQQYFNFVGEVFSRIWPGIERGITRHTPRFWQIERDRWLAYRHIFQRFPQSAILVQPILRKTLEYMAVSKPSVAFDLPETRRVAGDAALYARPNSAEDFADKIEILLNDEALREQMGAVGRKRIDEEFSWDHTKTELLRAYEALVSEKL